MSDTNQAAHQVSYTLPQCLHLILLRTCLTTFFFAQWRVCICVDCKNDFVVVVVVGPIFPLFITA